MKPLTLFCFYLNLNKPIKVIKIQAFKSGAAPA